MIEPVQLFRDEKYGAARAKLDALATKYPKSATVPALRGDATLFDESIEYVAAARQALVFYDAAMKLLDDGCSVRRRTEYYLLMGDAYASLRLDDEERAYAALSRAEKRFSTSAEVHYNLARVHCARADRKGEASRESEAPSAGRAPEIEACVVAFERALELAESPDRPLFFRTHRSAEDWIVRSETQSELGRLRKDPRYAAIISTARERVAGKKPR